MNIALKITHWRCRIWNGAIRAFELSGTGLKVADLHLLSRISFLKKTNCEFTSIFGFFMELQIHILRYRAAYATDPTKLVPANYDPTALATKFNFKTEKYSVKWLIHFVFFMKCKLVIKTWMICSETGHEVNKVKFHRKLDLKYDFGELRSQTNRTLELIKQSSKFHH